MKIESIRYQLDRKTFRGALVYDDTVRGRLPALLISPNWPGTTPAANERAETLARCSAAFFTPTPIRAPTFRAWPNG
jgi:hypothetical protein